MRFAFISFLIVCATGCASHISTQAPTVQLPDQVHTVPIANISTPVENTSSQLIKPLSPYSSEGMIALNQFRTHNSSLNDFLIRNRKPDYFFSGANEEFSYQKIYLIYLESDSLYLFDATHKNPYKKFNPLPESIKQSMKDIEPRRPIIRAEPTSSYTATHGSNSKPADSRPYQQQSSALHNIEADLWHAPQGPLLTAKLLKEIPTSNTPIYADIYYIDKPIKEMLENDYSIKYDKQKEILKIIFPQSYSADLLYKNKAIETKKIIMNGNFAGGKSLSLVVPDFLPGSAFYESLHDNMKKAFSSLYLLKIHPKVSDPENLRIRLQVKLCQPDAISYCKASSKTDEQIRAIVIAATLYDPKTGTPLETLSIK